MKAAIVGCGSVASVHAAGIKAAGGTLAAVCDIIPGLADAFAGKYDAAAYYTLDEMLDAEKPDVLHICTPHYLHLQMAENAASRGIDVLLEKPPAITEQQFSRLGSIKSGARLCVCFQNRLNDTTVYAKQLIDSGELGGLIGARGLVTWRREGSYYTDSGWRGTSEKEGGSVLINQALHTLDLLCFFLGSPTGLSSIRANMSHPETACEDTVCAEIGFGQKKAVFYATISNVCSPDAEVTLYFEKGELNVSAHECILRPKGGKRTLIDAGAENPGKVCWGSSHARLIAAFYGGKNPCPLESCADTMRLLDGIYSGGLLPPERKNYDI